MNIANYNFTPAYLIKNKGTTTTTTTTTTTFFCPICNEYAYSNIPSGGATITFYSCLTGNIETLDVLEGETGVICNCDSVGSPSISAGTLTPTGNSC